MTNLEATAAVAEASLVPADPQRRLWRRVLASPIGLISVGIILLVIVAGVVGPFIAPFGPDATRLELTNAPPFTSEFILGGDQAGRDILTRLLYGSRGAIQAAAIVLLVSAGLGVTTGLLAGYYGGRFDSIASWITDATMAMPGFVLLIALYTLIGPSIMVSMAVFGVLIAPAFYHLVRNLTRAVRQELYVDAAIVFGLPDRRIIARHILRAIRGPIIVQSAFVLAAGIGIQAALEFLGLGSRDSPSWGAMLQDSFNNIYVNPVNIIWPAALITLTTMALILMGNVLRDALQSSATRPSVLKPDVVRQLRADAAAELPAARAPISANHALLTVENLSIGYPDSAASVRAVVHGVDLVIERGEIHGLVGESGSGKSQIANSILGILPKEAVILSGRVRFHDRDLLNDGAALHDVRGRRVAYIPQEPMTNLYPLMTIGQQLQHGLRAVSDVSKRAAKEKLVTLLGRVGIHNPRQVYDLYPHQVSGGMAQRVLIAGALASDPELIIADEPTTALDVTVQADILDLLRDLKAERNLGVLLVTHNFGVVADLCDRVSVMKDGRIVESRAVSELFARPEHEYTKMLLASTLEGAPARAPLAAMETSA